MLVIDTHALAAAYYKKTHICPINSGSTIRKPARRGIETFTPLGEMPYKAWQKKRGKQDRILEVTVLDHIPDIKKYTIDRVVV